MEGAARGVGYDYRSNSNLVLTLETNRSRDLGPTGEVTSLVGKMDENDMTRNFGDRAVRGRPKEVEDRIEKSKKKRALDKKKGETRSKKKKVVTRDRDVLTAEVDSVYRPQSSQTRDAYKVLLNFIQEEVSDKPHDYYPSIADEILGFLKNDRLKQKEKQSAIEKIIGRGSKPMDEDRFSKLVNIGKSITDYKADKEEKETTALPQDEKALEASEMGLSVVFEKDAAEGDSDVDEIKEESDEEEGDGADTSKSFQIQTTEDSGMVDDDDSREELDARTVDAFWIQRQVAKFYKDEHVARQMAEDILTNLSADANDGQVENKLVLLLDYDKFPFIKLLLRNRQKVAYCTRLARAQGDEKKKLEDEMNANPKLKAILESLHKTTTAADRNQETERRLLAEARTLGLRKGGTTKSEGESKTSDAFWAKRAKTLLDMDALAFSQAGHFMSNTECKLPDKSQTITKKGYQEVHIPPLRSTLALPGENIMISSLPEWARPAFPKPMNHLNRVQSKVYQTAMLSAENMLLCAPTGAGKTNVAMLAMLREIGLHRKPDGSVDLDAFKIIYVAPMKSLVQEMVANFSGRLQAYGMSVRELSGDNQLTKEQIHSTQVIVTTPEKWDIITRKSGDRTYTQLVKLLIIDEIHLLHDSRGPVLESLVSRTIRQIESTQELIRIVGLSATLPNYEDVAMFLRVKPEKGLFYFDNSYRPVPLQQQYIGITQKKAFKRHELMNQICYEKVMEQAGRNQVLIFVHSRKETATCARMIRDMALEKDEVSKFIKPESGRREMLTQEAENVKDSNLKELLPYGFAIHNAGMTRPDRTLVEELFADGHIQVLVSTATLAWGVNLPAHTVIIKGTQVYDPEKGQWVELSPLDVMQMMGRAGRPQFDTEGEGIIITSHKELHYYLSLLNQQLPIESQFISRLADNLNAEVVLGSITNVKEAVNWLGYTYLYIRMLRRPQLYGIQAEEYEADPLLEQRRIDLIHTAATLLDKHNLIKYDRKSGNFQVTDLGRVGSHYYITHQSMAVFNEYLKPTMSDIEIFRVFSLSSEFKHMTVREEEKMELAKLLDKVPIPVKESIEEPSAKTNVLLQAYISRLKLDGFALISDMVFITQSAGRIMRALFEIVLKRGWAAVAVKALNLCKMIDHRMWGAQSPLRQFKGIPSDIIKRIEGKDWAWERFYDLEAHAIGELIRFPKMGKPIHKAVHQLPRLDLQGHVQPITRSVLRVELVITPDFMFDDSVHGNAEPFWILVEDVDGETILHHEYFLLKKRFAAEEHTVNFTIPIYDPLPPQYYIRVISDKWLGSEVVLPISFRHLILPEKYPPPTELLDLQPLSITEVGNERYIRFFQGRFDTFNPIQTQVFNTVYKRDDSTLVAAPTGSGKTVIAELAIMRMLSQHHGGRAVYVAPVPAIALEKYKEWRTSFSKIGINVVMFTGDISTDLRLLQDGQVIITIPRHWDVMSRRWKNRKNVQTVKLFVVDEMHLIGGGSGPILEVIVSRMRFIASQTDMPIRILGLCTSVANATDLGEWIGCTPSSLFNFHPNVRPVPLEIRVQGFDITNFSGRQLAMVKPAYSSIKAYSPDKPVIVFVPGRKQAQTVAIDFMTFCSSEDEPTRFLRLKPEDIVQFLEKRKLKNETLKNSLCAGVGYYHSGQTEEERSAVEDLFKSEAIQIVVAEYELCWGMTMASHMVIIMGTQQYDVKEHRYVDCPITDVIQMMGRASRPLLDSSGVCSIFCQSSKKEFYKKFLYEPFPVESHLDHELADHLNAEIVTRRIENVQDAVDYLTWSFLYRRLTQNPNYYNLQGTSHRHVSDHLSELVENTLEDLSTSKCIALENETDLSAINLGMIAAYYYIKYTSVELFSSSLKSNTKLHGLLETLASASEFDSVPVRHREEFALEKLAHHLPLKISNPGSYSNAHTKTNVLLQSHFSRLDMSAAVAEDQSRILPDAGRLLQAMVDVISSNGWLSPALAAMELSQMVTQGVWNTDSVLLQLPHFTPSMVRDCEAKGVKTIPELIEMEDKDRTKLLALSAAKFKDVVKACNAYPDVDMKFQVENKDKIKAKGKCVVTVQLEREGEDEEEEHKPVKKGEEEGDAGVPRVSAPRYPLEKAEGWWLVIGDLKKNELISIKRIAMKRKKQAVQLEFVAPAQGTHNLNIYFMSDSYIGVDQEYPIELKVLEGDKTEEVESDEE